MTTEEKIIKNKLGLVNLADMLGNVSQACRDRHDPHGLQPRQLLLLREEGGALASHLNGSVRNTVPTGSTTSTSLPDHRGH